jgi:hypothetical protein
MGLNDNHVKDICIQMKRNTTILRLDLDGNDLSNAAADRVMSILGQKGGNTTLCFVMISGLKMQKWVSLIDLGFRV